MKLLVWMWLECDSDINIILLGCETVASVVVVEPHIDSTP